MDAYEAVRLIKEGKSVPKELVILTLNYYWDEMLGNDQLKQIKKGIQDGVDYTWYADRRYNWRQMREIRLGLKNKIDFHQYLNPMLNYQRMKEIRLELEKKKKHTLKQSKKN